MTRGKRLLSIGVFLIALSSLTWANGLNLNGFGARAAGMGGAFVGLADDYTAVFWNPAGLAQFNRKTFGVTADMLMPSQCYIAEHSYAGGMVDTDSLSKVYPAGLAGYFHPVGENLVLGIGIYTPSGLGTEWDGSDFTAMSLGMAYDWMSYIGAISISPAVAYQVSDQVYVGATLNVIYGFFKIDRWAEVHPLGVNLGQYTEDSHGWGVSGTLGLLVKPSEQFSFGATFRTPAKVTMKGDVGIDGLASLGLSASSEFEREVTYPFWLAAGIAYHVMENFTITIDGQYTDWSQMDMLKSTVTDPVWKAQGVEDSLVLDLHWESKIQLRAGMEYRLDNIAIRGGYYYDPAPAPDETMNFLVPSFTYHVITGGFGYSKDAFSIGLTLEYLMGQDREITEPMPPFSLTHTHGMNIFVAILGFQYGF